MKDDRSPTDGSAGRRVRRIRGVRGIWRFLVRLDLASLLLLILVVVAVAGSTFPQRPSSPADDPEALAHWRQEVHSRYGRLTGFLNAMGAFRWFGSPVWRVPAGLLVVATLACTIDRWQRVWRRAFRRPVRCPEAAFDSAACTAKLRLSPSTDPVHAVRDVLEQRGFQVRSRVDDDIITVRGDRNPLAPLATLITHAAVLLLVLGAVVSTTLGWREDLTLGPQETVDISNRSEAGSEATLRLRSEGVRVSRYADGSVAGYDAQVTVIEGSRETTRGHIHLNEPLIYQGIGFYLRSYAPLGEGYSLALQAVRDPGYALVVAAGLLLFLGMTISFSFPPCCVRARIKSHGLLRLAGHADRRVWDFEREFDGLVRSLVES